MRVLLINNKPIPPYVGCPEMTEGDIYVVAKQKTNFKGDLVYMFDGFYGWKLATRFVIWENFEDEMQKEETLELEISK